MSDSIRAALLTGVALALLKGAVAAPAGFVTASGTDLLVDGKTFCFSGGNTYTFLNNPHWLTEEQVLADIDEHFGAAANLGLSVIRAFAFCNQPSGLPKEEGMLKLDYAISKAEEAGVKLIIVFANWWNVQADEGSGGTYIHWSATAERPSDFYTDPTCRQLYKSYVDAFVNRRNTFTNRIYKEDPAIMVWELMNEARCPGDLSGRTIAKWMNDMAAYVKSVDPNHLVATGEDGHYLHHPLYDGYTWRNPDNGTDFIMNLDNEHIDVGSFHVWPHLWYQATDYTTQDRREFVTRWVTEHIKDAHELGKPCYVGEFGYATPTENRDLTNRDSIFLRNMEACAAGNGSGALYWNMTPGHELVWWMELDVMVPEDTSTCEIIRDFSNIMATRNGMVPDVSIGLFAADDASIVTGKSTTLRWRTANATSVTLDGDAVDPNASLEVSPSATTLYLLVVQGKNGPATEELTVTVGSERVDSVVVVPALRCTDVGQSVVLAAILLDQARDTISRDVSWQVGGGGSLSSNTGNGTTFTSDSTIGRIGVTAESEGVTGTAWIVVRDPEKLHLRLNCGGPAVGAWEPDTAYLIEDYEGEPFDWGGEHDVSDVVDPAPPEVYQSVRHSAASSGIGEHAYHFGVENGPYTLRIHFTDTQDGTGRRMAYFVEGRDILDNFSIVDQVGGPYRVFIKEYDVEVVDGNGLQMLCMAYRGDDVFEAGIEIIDNSPLPEVTSAMAPHRAAGHAPVQGLRIRRLSGGRYRMTVVSDRPLRVRIMTTKGTTVESFVCRPNHAFIWDARCQGAGVYLVRAESGSRHTTRRIVLSR